MNFNLPNIISSFLQVIPDIRGKRRICNFIISNIIPLKLHTPKIIKGKYSIIYHLPNLQDSISLELFYYGIYEKEYFDLLCQYLPMNAYFLDIGANIGSISIPLAKKEKI